MFFPWLVSSELEEKEEEKTISESSWEDSLGWDTKFIKSVKKGYHLLPYLPIFVKVRLLGTKSKTHGDPSIWRSLGTKGGYVL